MTLGLYLIPLSNLLLLCDPGSPFLTFHHSPPGSVTLSLYLLLLICILLVVLPWLSISYFSSNSPLVCNSGSLSRIVVSLLLVLYPCPYPYFLSVSSWVCNFGSVTLTSHHVILAVTLGLLPLMNLFLVLNTGSLSLTSLTSHESLPHSVTSISYIP